MESSPLRRSRRQAGKASGVEWSKHCLEDPHIAEGAGAASYVVGPATGAATTKPFLKPKPKTTELRAQASNPVRPKLAAGDVEGKVWDRLVLLMLVLGTVLSGSGTSITHKLMGNQLPEHMFVVLLLAVPVISAGFFIAAYASGEYQKPIHFPKQKLALMAVFDTIQMLLATLSQSHISGKLQSVLSKTSLLFTIALQWARGSNVTRAQLLGGAVSMLGALVALDAFSTTLGDTAAERPDPLWCGVFILSTISYVMGVAVKQHALQAEDVPENFMNAWTALFQALFTVVLLPVTMGLEGIPTEELVPRLQNGLMCIVSGKCVGSCDPAQDTCMNSKFVVGLWLLLLFLLNALMVTLVKRAGAVLMMATNVLITPCTNLAYSLPFLMGEHAEPINAANIVGLAITIVGMIIYRTKELNFNTF